MFGPRAAARQARRYRRRGLDGTARRMVDFLTEHGVSGATVLEIGGGVGDIQVELLRRGAARTTNLELSPGYESSAAALLDETGMTGRADRRIHDIAAHPDAVEPADVVVLHRVVCCYPDYGRLLAAAADHARQLLVFSYPPDNPVSKVLLRVPNLVYAARRMRYRAFAHPIEDMLGVLAEHGLRAVYGHRGVAWQVAGLAR
jgi:hypothetical protein